jgi:hypothetical protein
VSPRAGHRNYQTNLRLSKYIDMTIHWKALEEHFLTGPLVFNYFSIQPFSGKKFSEFFSNKTSVLRLKQKKYLSWNIIVTVIEKVVCRLYYDI